jgi:hypothetical protein
VNPFVRGRIQHIVVTTTNWSEHHDYHPAQ